MAEGTKSGIEAILAERGSRYGEFLDNAKFAQDLKDFWRSRPEWEGMAHFHREWLDMLAIKLCRVFNGDPYYDDNYTDIIGYTQLVKDLCAASPRKVVVSDGAGRGPSYMKDGVRGSI